MLTLFSTLLAVAHFSIIFGLVLRVIMRRPPIGIAYAWLLLILALPIVGVVLYLLVGERRIGRLRASRLRQLQAEFEGLAARVVPKEFFDVDWSMHRPELKGIARLGENLAGSRVVRRSQLELIDDTEAILTRIAEDIDAAESCVLMEFYIWHVGGLADRVLEALIRAAQRGVTCLVLVDAIGGRPWWRSDQPKRLRQAGVDLRPALPVGPARMIFGRADLRMHRKMVVVDGRVGWTGSMNLVDPAYFKQDAGVGPWVDAMVRIQGAAVAPLISTVLADWLLETRESLEPLLLRLPNVSMESRGEADVQLIRSGPGQGGDALLHAMLACIHVARREVSLTTPYFIPDESLLQAMRGAAGRGVIVRLVVPEKIDSWLTRFACRSYFDDLLSAGVEIYRFRNGLLHTKSIRVDDDLCLFGTANLDLRSLWLNYELSMLIFDASFNQQIARLHERYLRESVRLDQASWEQRPYRHRMLENTLRLVSPLL